MVPKQYKKFNVPQSQRRKVSDYAYDFRKSTVAAKGSKRGFKGASYDKISVIKTIRLPDFNCTTLPLTESFNYYTFLPNSLQDWTAYAGLYEKFMLTKVVITFEPKFTSNLMISSSDPSTSALSMFNNRFYTYFDAIDQTIPTTMDFFHERPKAKYTKLNKKHSRTLYPKVREDIDDATFGTIYKQTNGWYSTDTPPQYFGLKVGVEEYFTSAAALSYPLSYNVYVKYYLRFKEPQ
jgi:hypothetical protein